MVGFITPNGELINGDELQRFTHRDLEEKLKLNIKNRYLSSVYVYKYIRINDGSRKGFEYEVLAELPDIITNEQIITLTNWLDELSYRREFVNIEIDALQVNHKNFHNETNCKFYKRYYFKEFIVDDIIKDIKNYYSIKSCREELQL